MRPAPRCARRAAAQSPRAAPAARPAAKYTSNDTLRRCTRERFRDHCYRPEIESCCCTTDAVRRPSVLQRQPVKHSRATCICWQWYVHGRAPLAWMCSESRKPHSADHRVFTDSTWPKSVASGGTAGAAAADGPAMLLAAPRPTFAVSAAASASMSMPVPASTSVGSASRSGPAFCCATA